MARRSSTGSSRDSNESKGGRDGSSSTSGGAGNNRPGGSTGGFGVHTSALDSMSDKLAGLSTDIEQAGAKVGAARPGGNAFGVVGQSLSGKVDNALDGVQQHFGSIAKATRGAQRKVRDTVTDLHDNESGIARSMRRIADPQSPPSTHDPGAINRADGPGTARGVRAAPSPGATPASAAGRKRPAPSDGSDGPPAKAGRQTYRDGTHGAKVREQQRLSQAHGTQINGESHQSEHSIGFEVLNRGSGKARGEDSEARTRENHAMAYQEDKESHRAHPGTGTSNKTDGSGFNAQSYRDAQRQSLEDGRAGNAIQLNQLGYAHRPEFHDSTGTTGGHAADDSYNQHIDNADSVRYATGPGRHQDVQLTAQDKAEDYLARQMARTGQYPTPEQRAEARARYGVDDDL